MATTYKPLIVFDFDGVIHSYTSGWKGVAVIPDAPVPGSLEWLNLAYIHHKDEIDIAIFSSRSKSLSGRRAMKKWLRQAFFDYYMFAFERLGPSEESTSLVNFSVWYMMKWIKWPWFKPAAFITIDDRALQFQGTFLPVTDLLAFKPWKVTSGQ